jgi:hypothetical protein
MILAHQYLGQLSPKLLESFGANTSVKFAGGVSDKDARAFSHMLRCSPEFIEGQPKLHFAAFIRNFTPSAVALSVPFGRLEDMPRMTPAELAHVRSDMRARYAVPWRETREPNAEHRGDRRASGSEENTVNVNPASEWSFANLRYVFGTMRSR